MLDRRIALDAHIRSAPEIVEVPPLAGHQLVETLLDRSPQRAVDPFPKVGERRISGGMVGGKLVQAERCPRLRLDAVLGCHLIGRGSVA